jgi:hypothetical protein
MITACDAGSDGWFDGSFLNTEPDSMERKKRRKIPGARIISK